MDVQEYLYALAPYLTRRNKLFYPESVPNLPDGVMSVAMKTMYPTFEPTILVDDSLSIELGGMTVEVIHTPGAEGADSISVWLPDQKILFTGDFFGPIFPMFPNLTTVRGEKFRPAMPYVRSLNRVLALEPEMIVPSHFEPIVGKERIRADVTRIRDAVLYVHDEVVDGMNEGKDVYTLMNEITLPPELDLSQAHGTVPWTVRGIWEGYATWFHFRSTTELYPVPASAVHSDVVELAGGPGPVAERAALRVSEGQPVEALYLAEMALEVEPDHAGALHAQLEALELLLELAGGVNHHHMLWLEHQIRDTQERLDLEPDA
jgi:alkyl sulfatase BDS1-like metallo-beta-lactamase superfamily hydrolase